MTAAHSQLKAVRLLAEDTDNDYVVDDFFLTAPQMVAELRPTPCWTTSTPMWRHRTLITPSIPSRR